MRKIDELTYDYMELGMPNVLLQKSRDRKYPEDSRIEKFIEPLIVALAKKHPQWQFISDRIQISRPKDEAEYLEAYEFFVFHNKEFLGEIGTGYGRNSSKVFSITNERIRSNRMRGTEQKTKDLDKAIKIVGKLFGSKTVLERITMAEMEAADVIRRVTSDRSYTFNRSFDSVIKSLTPYIMSNWETLSAVAIQEGADPNIVSELLSKYDEYKITKRIYECEQAKTGVVVLIHGNDYVVKAKDASGELGITTYSTETLPVHIKTAVGMLKLLEPNNFIADVGVKIEKNEFYVVKEADK